MKLIDQNRIFTKKYLTVQTGKIEEAWESKINLKLWSGFSKKCNNASEPKINLCMTISYSNEFSILEKQDR